MSHAPIALFAYNRPEHLRQTVEALRRNAGAAASALHVFSDGPRDLVASKGVGEVRRYLRSIDGFASVQVVERESNFGLAKSIIDGVNRLCETHGRVIVVEDDLVTSPHFLRFMNAGLDCYAGADLVASIHGYTYPVAGTLPETFFLRGADCWGWATWKRAWAHFNPDGAALLRELKARDLTHGFDSDGSYPFTRMLRNQIAGKNDSWAIRWHASAYLKNMLTLYPGRSLVFNTGNDGSGMHCSTTQGYDAALAAQAIDVRPIEPREDEAARALFSAFHRANHVPLPRRIWRKLAASLARSS
jgi:hypothetical protein